MKSEIRSFRAPRGEKVVASDWLFLLSVDQSYCVVLPRDSLGLALFIVRGPIILCYIRSSRMLENYGHFQFSTVRVEFETP